MTTTTRASDDPKKPAVPQPSDPEPIHPDVGGHPPDYPPGSQPGTSRRVDEPPLPGYDHPASEAEYKRPLPRPGDRDWVAGSPVTEAEADKTESEAKARLAEGRKAAEARSPQVAEAAKEHEPTKTAETDMQKDAQKGKK